MNEIIVENAFLDTSRMDILILSVNLLKGQIIKNGILVIDDKNKIQILDAEIAMKFEKGKTLYHVIVKKDDVENMNGVRLSEIFRKNICRVIG